MIDVYMSLNSCFCLYVNKFSKVKPFPERWKNGVVYRAAAGCLHTAALLLCAPISNALPAVFVTLLNKCMPAKDPPMFMKILHGHSTFFCTITSNHSFLT